MRETLKNAWKVVEIRKKILYTIGMLLIYRLLCFVPVPGVDASYIATALEKVSLLGFINSMTGSNLSQYTVMAMAVPADRHIAMVIRPRNALVALALRPTVSAMA